MAVEQQPRRRPPTAQEARQSLEQNLAVPELFAGDVDSLAISARAEAPPTRRGVRHERIGVVFVHGVGSQRKGDTLREFGTPLVDWLEEWHRSRPNETTGAFRVTWSELSPPHSDEPARTVVALPKWTDPNDPARTGEAQTWVLSEAWWAPRVEAPEYTTMLNWAWKRLPWLIEGLVDGAQQAISRPLYFKKGTWPARFEQLAQFVNTVAVSLLYVLAEILLLLALVVLALVARLPIPGLNRFVLIRLVRPLLVDNVGDFYIFLYDRIQAAHIRQSIYETVNYLLGPAQCSRVLIAAHSGGTVVAVDSLGTDDIKGQPGAPAILMTQLKDVTTLVTFGAALNKAWHEAEHTDQGKPARTIPHEFGGLPTTWLNFWTHYDWAHPGRPLEKGPAKGGTDGSIEVTNGLSPLVDHGGYLSNYEQFISRLASEIEKPGTHGESRFWDAGRSDLRRGLVAILTAWRTIAILGGIAVLASRYWFGWPDARDAAADGLVFWDQLSNIPVAGAFLSGLEVVVGRLTLIPGALPDWLLVGALLALSGMLFVRRGLLSGLAAVGLSAFAFVLRDPNALTTLRGFAFGVTAAVAVFILAAVIYYLWLGAMYAAWSTGASLRSARKVRPGISWALTWRTAVFVLLVAAVNVSLAIAPPFADIPVKILSVLGLA